MFNNKILPNTHNKSAHHFDFDETLTRFQVPEWTTPPSKETCDFLLKPRVLDIFRSIWAKHNNISIITNGSEHRVRYILERTGFTRGEINKIAIFAADSGGRIKYGFKSNVIRYLAKKWGDVKEHFFYDNRPFFIQEVERLIPEFARQGKTLKVISVHLISNDIEHLEYVEKINADTLPEAKAHCVIS